MNEQQLPQPEPNKEPNTVPFDALEQARFDAANTPNSEEQRYLEWVGERDDEDLQTNAQDMVKYLENRPYQDEKGNIRNPRTNWKQNEYFKNQENAQYTGSNLEQSYEKMSLVELAKAIGQSEVEDDKTKASDMADVILAKIDQMQSKKALEGLATKESLNEGPTPREKLIGRLEKIKEDYKEAVIKVITDEMADDITKTELKFKASVESKLDESSEFGIGEFGAMSTDLVDKFDAFAKRKGWAKNSQEYTDGIKAVETFISTQSRKLNRVIEKKENAIATKKLNALYEAVDNNAPIEDIRALRARLKNNREYPAYKFTSKAAEAPSEPATKEKTLKQRIVSAGLGLIALGSTFIPRKNSSTDNQPSTDQPNLRNRVDEVASQSNYSIGFTNNPREVAHSVAPGNENSVLQAGINMYNHLYNTHFELKSSEDEDVIVDGEKVISPTQMYRLNELIKQAS